MILICPHCSLNIDTPPELAGSTVACPACAEEFVVPEVQEVVSPPPPPVSRSPRITTMVKRDPRSRHQDAQRHSAKSVAGKFAGVILLILGLIGVLFATVSSFSGWAYWDPWLFHSKLGLIILGPLAGFVVLAWGYLSRFSAWVFALAISLASFATAGTIKAESTDLGTTVQEPFLHLFLMINAAFVYLLAIFYAKGWKSLVPAVTRADYILNRIWKGILLVLVLLVIARFIISGPWKEDATRTAFEGSEARVLPDPGTAPTVGEFGEILLPHGARLEVPVNLNIITAMGLTREERKLPLDFRHVELPENETLSVSDLFFGSVADPGLNIFILHDNTLSWVSSEVDLASTSPEELEEIKDLYITLIREDSNQEGSEFLRIRDYKAEIEDYPVSISVTYEVSILGETKIFHNIWLSDQKAGFRLAIAYDKSDEGEIDAIVSHVIESFEIVDPESEPAN